MVIMEDGKTYGHVPFATDGLLGAPYRVEKTKEDVERNATNADVASEEFNGNVQHTRNMSFLGVRRLD